MSEINLNFTPMFVLISSVDIVVIGYCLVCETLYYHCPYLQGK